MFLIHLYNVLVFCNGTAAYVAVGTLILRFVINKTMGFKVIESEENIGLDKTQHGEVAFNI